MAEEPNFQNPLAGKNASGEIVPKEGTEGEITPQPNPVPTGDGLTPEEREEIEQFREIKKTTGFTKFSESAREAIRLKQEKEIAEAKLAEKASENLSVQEERLSQKYADWEVKSEDEKELIRETERLKSGLAELKQKQAWQEEFSATLKKFPQLQKADEDFREFAGKPENSNVPLAFLAKSFLFEKPELLKEEEPIPVRRGLEKPSGGSRVSPVPEYTMDDSEKMMKTNPKRYMRLLKEGKFDNLKE